MIIIRNENDKNDKKHNKTYYDPINNKEDLGTVLEHLKKQREACKKAGIDPTQIMF